MEFRTILVDTLMKMMEKDDKICILDADLSKPNGTQPLYEKYPNRCFNVGIAEANMVGVAAGLSAYGYKPIVFSFAPFITRRVCDQIAVSVAYAKQNVKFIGSDPGICAELNGGTHMSFEDIAVLRSIPDMIIFDVTDEKQLPQAIKQILEYNGPAYIRIPRKLSAEIFKDDYKYELCKADIVKKGNDVTIVASGIMVKESLKAIEMLEQEGISVELISANTIKPLDKETILESVKKTNHLVTCENHSLIGGLYSAVSELICREYPVKIGSIGVKDKFGQVGKYSDLLEEYELTSKHIYNAVKNNLK